MGSLKKLITLLGLTAVLAGCGGGGSDGNDALGQSQQSTIQIVTNVTTLQQNNLGLPVQLNSPFTGQVNVRITRPDGTPPAEGTIVSMRVDDVAVAAVSRLDDPETTDINEFTTLFGQVSAETSGGLATFFVHSLAQTGTAALTASATDPESPGRVLQVTRAVQVLPGPQPSQRIEIITNVTTLPQNIGGLPSGLDSPFVGQVNVRVSRIDGSPVPEGTVVGLRVDNLAVAAVSTIDDPATAENELLVLVAQVTSETSGGLATFFVHSQAQIGSATLTASATDADTGFILQASRTVQVVAGPEPPERIEIFTTVTTLPQNLGFAIELDSPFIAQVSVRISRPDGSPAADGTVISLQSSDFFVAALSVQDDAGTLTTNEFTDIVPQVTQISQGGLASFFLHSGRQIGTATLTASVTDPTTNITLQATQDIQIVVGPDLFERIAIETRRQVLPANLFGVAPFLGSPFISEVTVTRRGLNGDLISAGTIAVSVNPVEIGAFSTLDDPETTGEDENEFLILLGSGPVGVTAGKATIFFHAFAPGTAVMTITAVDDITGATISNETSFVVSESVPALPSEISFITTAPPLYIPESGGNSNYAMQMFVGDGAGEGVPDPETAGTAVNNVQIEILQDGAAGSESVTALAADGTDVEGTLIQTRTFAGVVSAVFRAGTRQGTIALRVTADRRDNNVSNGIQDPVITQQSLTVSDGRLFSIQITVPNTNALRINRVSGVVTTDGTVPPDPDGTYSLTVSAIGTDRQGNPVLPGTPITFGLVDSPITGFPGTGEGTFVIAGGDGDPVEGGRTFTAPNGQFTSAGGGAGPGDTLLIFGEESNGNRDLESARTVAAVDSGTSLTVTTNFNLNDDTGQTVNNGPVLPYLVGRATIGNISSSAATDELGVASTTMNYPTTALGHVVAVWARGTGDTVGSNVELVTDAEVLVYPGAADATMVVSPSVIPANSTSQVTICVFDATSSPLQGFPISFQFNNPPATASVDGQALNGVVTERTGTSGCTTASVTTGGIASNTIVRSVMFAAGSATGTVTIGGPENSLLQAFPSSFIGTGGRVTLRLVDGTGQPIPDVFITATCAGEGGAAFFITEPPGVTDADGFTQSLITTSGLIGGDDVGNGSCTFRAAAGEPSTVVQFIGINICRFAFSPGC